MKRSPDQWRAVRRARVALRPLFYVLCLRFSSALRPPPSALLLLLPGCGAAGALVYKVQGPPSVPARYEPGPVRAVVLAENFRSPSASAVDADRLAAMLTNELDRHRVVGQLDAKAAAKSDAAVAAGEPPTPAGEVIGPGEVASLRTRRAADYAGLTVAQVGRAVGADAVLYVDLLAADAAAAAGGSYYKGQATASVKWVDAHTGRTLWPTDLAGGYSLSYETGVRPQERSTPDAVRADALRGLAADIGRLFYAYKPDEIEKVEPEL